MSHKAERMAESVASATTRRGFLGRLAKTAGTAAAAMAGVLATRPAHAGRGGAKMCCVYQCIDWDHGVFYFKSKCSGSRNCQSRFKGCDLVDSYPVNDCSECGY